MPPVFGPVSPSPTRLKSCAGSSGTAVTPSHTANSETSGPARYSSTSTGWPDARTAPAWATAAARSLVTTTPLPAARPSSLTTYGAPQRVSASSISAVGGDPDRAGGRHAGRGHHVLGERLRTLDPGRSGARPEDREPSRPQRVGGPVDQRHLGSDHDQIGRDRCRELGDGDRVRCVHRMGRSPATSARVAGSRCAGRRHRGRAAAPGAGRARGRRNRSPECARRAA